MKGQTIDAITVLKLKHTAALEAALSREVTELKGDIGTPAPPHSRPGTPPHVVTGRLEAGAHYEMPEGEQLRGRIVSSREGSPQGLPAMLEWGTSRVAARPFMRPSMDRMAANLLHNLAETLAQGRTLGND